MAHAKCKLANKFLKKITNTIRPYSAFQHSDQQFVILEKVMYV